MENYNINDVSEKQLKFGTWFLEHVNKFKKIIIISLIVFSAITLSFGIFGFVWHFVQQEDLDRDIAKINSMYIDFTSYQERNRAENIIFSEPEVIYTGDNSYDIFTKVKNPNNKWMYLDLTYQFQAGDYLTPTTTIYLLPNEERYLFSLANVSPKRLANLTIKVLEQKGKRVKGSLDLPEIDFSTSKPDFFVSDDESRSWISFMATNNTIQNYWEVTWQAFLYSGRKVVGINQIRIEEFESAQDREVVMSWFERLPRVSTVEVFPVVDLLNPDITYKIPGEIDELY